MHCCNTYTISTTSLMGDMVYFLWSCNSQYCLAVQIRTRGKELVSELEHCSRKHHAVRVS